MSYIGNTPGVSSQRVVLEEVITGSPKSAFTPVSGYIKGYLDVLVNGVEVDTADFTATDGVTVTLVTAAAVGDTVKIKTWLPRGLSDGYLKTEADARFLNLAGGQLTGNLGLGVSPYPWALGKALDLNNSGLFGYSSGGVTGLTLAYNQYYNGTAWKAKETGASSLLQLNTASFRIFGSASVAANADVVLTPMLYVQKDYTFSLQNAASTPGTGIGFPATQLASTDPNALDDYEEGTWTPVFTGSGGNPTVTYSKQEGRYVKVGKMVLVQFDLRWTSKSGGSGALFVAGMPFTADGGYNYGVISEKQNVNLDSGYTYLTAEVYPSSSQLLLIQTGATNSGAAMGPGHIGNGGYVIGGTSYISSN